jgi:hypothetical protein
LSFASVPRRTGLLGPFFAKTLRGVFLHEHHVYPSPPSANHEAEPANRYLSCEFLTRLAALFSVFYVFTRVPFLPSPSRPAHILRRRCALWSSRRPRQPPSLTLDILLSHPLGLGSILACSTRSRRSPRAAGEWRSTRLEIRKLTGTLKSTAANSIFMCSKRLSRLVGHPRFNSLDSSSFRPGPRSLVAASLVRGGAG